MQHELRNIESVLNTVVERVNTDSVPGDYLKEVKNLMASEQDKIKSVFDDKLFRKESEASTARYFALHQKILVKLLDKVYEQEMRSDALVKRKAIVRLITEALENLLTYIKTDCSLYFNYGQKIPKQFQSTWLGKMADYVRALEAKYSNAAGNRELIDIAFHEFKSLNSSTADLSYGDLEYYELVQSRLLSLDTFADDETILKQDVCNCLISVNCRSPVFFKYYLGELQRILVTCETLSDRIDQASYFYKAVAQIQMETDLAFKLPLPHVKEQILEWLDHELNYLHEKRKLQSSCPPQSTIRGDFKLSFDLSVSQLAFLIRTFVETGVIQNKNTSELIRFIAKFVKTKKSEAISFDSFRTKLYNVESGTKDAVKKILQSMLQYMNKN